MYSNGHFCIDLFVYCFINVSSHVSIYLFLHFFHRSKFLCIINNMLAWAALACAQTYWGVKYFAKLFWTGINPALTNNDQHSSSQNRRLYEILQPTISNQTPFVATTTIMYLSGFQKRVVQNVNPCARTWTCVHQNTRAQLLRKCILSVLPYWQHFQKRKIGYRNILCFKLKGAESHSC